MDKVKRPAFHVELISERKIFLLYTAKRIFLDQLPLFGKCKCFHFSNCKYFDFLCKGNMKVAMGNYLKSIQKIKGIMEIGIYKQAKDEMKN